MVTGDLVDETGEFPLDPVDLVVTDPVADEVADLTQARLDLVGILGDQTLRLVPQFTEINHCVPPSVIRRPAAGLAPTVVDLQHQLGNPERVSHLDLAGISYSLPDGRPLLADVTFRLGQGTVTAVIGPNGTGKTTLLRIITGEVEAEDGAVTRSGRLGVMPQFIGQVIGSAPRPAIGSGIESGLGESSVRDLLLSVGPAPIRAAAADLDAAELAMMELDGGPDDDRHAMRYAQALADWADIDGYDQETAFDKACVAALGISYDRAKYRSVTSLSGGEQKRLVLEFLLAGPDELLLLDEPDNYLDVPGKVWLEGRLAETTKAVLLVSHDRELLANAADRIVTLEPGAAGAVSWVHGGSFATYQQARADRNSRLEELRRRWDEEDAKLRAPVLMYKTKATFNDGLASR